MLEFLKAEQVDPAILEGIGRFRAEHPPEEAVAGRVPAPEYRYYGKEVWEEAAAALLCGKNLLLAGGKATGKNVLAENLGYVFSRRSWGVSFHIDVDAAYLIGTDTYDGHQVVFRPGPIYQSGKYGGFCVLDEINMAKNEALAVLHAALDHRRVIDVPGYDSLTLHPAARFIATMNHGYAGTRELNEALVSRFAVLQMPPIDEEGLEKLIGTDFPSMDPRRRRDIIQLFLDLRLKAEKGEISDRCLDLRGLLDALRLMSRGLDVLPALDMGVADKTFDEFEKKIVHDCVAARISRRWKPADLFPLS